MCMYVHNNMYCTPLNILYININILCIIYVPTCTHMHFHAHTYMYLHASTYTHTYLHAHTYIYLHAHTYMPTHALSCTYVHVLSCTYVHVPTCIYMHTHALSCTYLYLHVHTDINTYNSTYCTYILAYIFLNTSYITHTMHFNPHTLRTLHTCVYL